MRRPLYGVTARHKTVSIALNADLVAIRALDLLFVGT